MATSTIRYAPFCKKQKLYMKKSRHSKMSVAEGAIRSSKTIMHCILAAIYLEVCPDKIHLASGSTIGNAKLNIGDCNGFGLEHLFRGRCRWGKYENNECLFVKTQTGIKIVIFAGGGQRDSYKKILGNSYGLWIATEINEHYDSDDSRESFIKVAFGRQVAAMKPYVLWDLNPCSPNHKIYKEYIDKYLEEFEGGYNYQHFTLHDNLSITDQRRKEIESQYDKTSIWYRRDILGQRCSAEGLCFQQFADHPNDFLIDEPPADIQTIYLGVDFGGNKSAHTFVATGMTRMLRYVVPLKSERVNAKDVDAVKLARLFCDFAEKIYIQFGKGMTCYCDSAEQTLINEIRKTVAMRRLPINVENAMKDEVNNRIRLINILTAQGRLKMIKTQTYSLQNALSSAIWNPKQAAIGIDERLDDGTSDIDTCDAFEYTIERLNSQLINSWKAV